MMDPVVPTLDAEVRSALRLAGAPIQMFGEGAPQRRQRLRILMAQQHWKDVQALRKACGAPVAASSSGTGRSGTVSSATHSRGPPALSDFRQRLFHQTASRAQERISQLKMDAITLKRLASGTVQARLAEVYRDEVQKLGRHLAVTNVCIERAALNATSPSGDAEDATEVQTLRVHLSAVSAGPATDCPDRMITGDAAGVVTVWDTSRGRPLASERMGYGRIVSIASLPNLIGSEDPKMMFVSCARNATGLTLWSMPIRNDDSENNIAEASSSSSSSKLSGERIPTDFHSGGTFGHGGIFHRVATDNTGSMLAATSSDSLVRVWDMTQLQNSGTAGQQPVQPLCMLDGLSEAHKANDVDFHPDGSLLSATDGAGRCSTWDMRSGDCVFSTCHQPHVAGPCTAVRWSPCGVRFATGGADHLVALWDARKLFSATPLFSPLAPPPARVAGHVDWISSLSFVPAGWMLSKPPIALSHSLPLLLCSTSLDGTLRMWDVMQNAACCLVHTVETSFVEGAIRGHCWVARPSGSDTATHDLVTISAAHHWTSWRASTATVTVSSHAYTVKEGAKSQSRVPSSDIGHDVDDEDDNDDEDDMTALRKDTVLGTASIVGGSGVAEDDDDDEDDMAALRK